MMNTRIGLQVRARGAIKPMTIATLAIVAGLLIAAWIFIIRPRQNAVSSDMGAKQPPAVTIAKRAAEPVNVEAMSLKDLLSEARKAMSEQRLLAPIGNNAFEFYLKVLQKQPSNQLAADALRETFPFAANNVEQIINQRDFNEAEREINLLAKVDSTNYTLTILRSKLDAQRKTLDQEHQQKLDQHLKELAAHKSNVEKPVAEKVVPEKLAQQPVSAEEHKEQIAKSEASTDQSATASKTQQTGTEQISEAVPVEGIKVRYPTAALRNNQQGWVDVQYMVNADGSVGNIQVLNAQPRRIFDNAAIEAIRRSRFTPAMQNGTAIASQQHKRIEFKLSSR